MLQICKPSFMYATSKRHFLTWLAKMHQSPVIKATTVSGLLKWTCNHPHSAPTVDLWQPRGTNNEPPVLQNSNLRYFYFWEVIHPSCKTAVFCFLFYLYPTSKYKRTPLDLTAHVSQYHRSFASASERQQSFTFCTVCANGQPQL